MEKSLAMDKEEWFVIVNPHAGISKGKKAWLEIKVLLNKHDIVFKPVFTTHRWHAAELVPEAIREGYRKIVIVGGDGLLFEVVNGLFNQNKADTREVLIGIIPVGSGNDWCRMYGISFDYSRAVELLVNGKTFIQDVGKVEFIKDGKQHIRYFANIAGMGYDAFVNERVNVQKDKGKGGKLIYLKNVITGLMKYKSISAQIQIDEKQFMEEVFSMNVGICRYNGGGMKQLPFAIADDGLLDVTIIKKTTKLFVIRNVKKLYDGSFVKLPIVSIYKGKSIKVDAGPGMLLEADGEFLGHSPIVFEIIPKSLKIIVNTVPV